MRIYSNNYDYYTQAYQLNAILNSKVSNEDSTSSKSETETKSSTKIRSVVSTGDMDINSLNYSGRMMMNSVKMQGEVSSEMSENMEKIKTDMDSIKNADIDKMSPDEVKNTLAKLKTDLESIARPEEEANNISNMNIDNMSDSDIKDALKKIQDKVNRAPEQNQVNKVSSLFSKVKEDMDSIKTADIDAMSSDDVKSTLVNLMTDMKSIPSPYGKSSKSQKIDTDNMSDSDMRDMLKKIQSYAKKADSETEDSDQYDVNKIDAQSVSE